MNDIHLIEKADQAGELLKPLRIDILKRLDRPRTCPELARELGVTTQKVNYHMNALAGAGLVQRIAERRNRGTLEGVYQASAKSYWFSPRLVKFLGGRQRTKDQASLAYLLQLAEDLQLDLGELIEHSDSETSHPSLGVDARIQLRDGAERAEFLADVKAFFTHLAQKYGATEDRDSGDEGAYRLMLACYQHAEKKDNTK